MCHRYMIWQYIYCIDGAKPERVPVKTTSVVIRPIMGQFTAFVLSSDQKQTLSDCIYAVIYPVNRVSMATHRL